MTMNRTHNFSAGPCTLPASVLSEIQAEFVDYQNSGMSLIEMSHRGPHYDAIHTETLDRFTRLFAVPDDFQILLLQGGATLQFAMAPMNASQPDDSLAYNVTGSWAKKAIKDAAKVRPNTYAAWDGGAENFINMPTLADLNLKDETTFLHVTSNETIGGIRMPDFFDPGIPVVADMSSDYLSRPIPWDRFDLVYGGAQKNLGPAGLTVVFARKSMIESAPTNLPDYLSYDYHAKGNSMANTPPVFAIWATGKVLGWMEEMGGVEAMQQRAASRSGMLYASIDGSNGFYRSPVSVSDRSHMNVVFRLPSEELERRFVSEAAELGMSSLNGHRSVGGIRASIYNAMPDEGVETLVSFMGEFAGRVG